MNAYNNNNMGFLTVPTVPKTKQPLSDTSSYQGKDKAA